MALSMRFSYGSITNTGSRGLISALAVQQGHPQAKHFEEASFKIIANNKKSGSLKT